MYKEGTYDIANNFIQKAILKKNGYRYLVLGWRERDREGKHTIL
jgi:hypothetical protein